MPVFNIFVKKANDTIVINTDDYPLASRMYAEEYGWRQVMGDSAASVKFTDDNKVPLKGAKLQAAIDEAREAIDKKLSDLRNGVLRRTRTGDAVMAEARRIATKLVQKDADFRAWANDEGVKPGDKAYTDELSERVSAKIDNDPRVLDLAERNVAALAELEA